MLKSKQIPQTNLTLQRNHKLRHYEREAFSQGFKCVVGIDEAGRGPLAGPVVAAACLLPEDISLDGLDDSKKLSKAKREKLFKEIQSTPCIIYGIGIVDSKIIDEINIYQATILAMKKAISSMPIIPDHLLIDGLPLPGFSIPSTAIVGGDSKSASIAAASILAKVTRDTLMEEYDSQWPLYKFKDNKGYGTKSHLNAIETFGACPIHRISWKPFQVLEKDELLVH